MKPHHRIAHHARITSGVFWSACKEFVKSDPFTQASAIAYSALFALPGVLIITVAVAAMFYDQKAVGSALYGEAGQLIGAKTAANLQEIVETARTQASGSWAHIIGVITLVISATSAFASLQGSLNRIWQVRPVPGRAVVKYLLSRLMSLALLGCFGFLLLVSLVLDTALSAFGDKLAQWMSGVSVVLISITNFGLFFSVITVMFALIFKLLPDVRVGWREVRSGAVVTALLFTGGKYVIGFYIGHSRVDDVFGAAGALIIILIWVYYSAVILLFGAQFTYVMARDHGVRTIPSDHAVKATARSPVDGITIGPVG